MASTPVRPSPLSPFDSANARQSPFRRQNSVSPATVRATTPTQSPTKQSSNLSPLKNGSLSPEKSSPFVRRPSQMGQNAGHPSSPFARPGSSLSITSSPTRKSSDEPKLEDDSIRASALRASRQPSVTPISDEDEPPEPPLPSPTSAARVESSSSRIINKPTPTLHSPMASPITPSQASLRPSTHRISAIKPPNFAATAAAVAAATSTPPKFHPAPSPSARTTIVGGLIGNSSAAGGGGGGGGPGSYTHLPPALLHSMRESFEVLDASNSGTIDSAAVAEMLSQLNLANDPAALSAFFPHHNNGPAQLNLARYLDMLSGPLGELSDQEELRAAFEAFDLDDSGQIDVATLREALLRPAEGDGRGEALPGMSERDVDAVLGEFSGRRAFGIGKGGKGEVFRYRDFMANVSAGGIGGGNGEGQGVVA